jgi:hypothetical protein
MVGPPSSTDATVARSADALRVVPKPVLIAVRLAAEEIVARSIPKEAELTNEFCLYYPKKSPPCQKSARATALIAGRILEFVPLRSHFRRDKPAKIGYKVPPFYETLRINGIKIYSTVDTA